VGGAQRRSRAGAVTFSIESRAYDHAEGRHHERHWLYCGRTGSDRDRGGWLRECAGPDHPVGGRRCSVRRRRCRAAGYRAAGRPAACRWGRHRRAGAEPELEKVVHLTLLRVPPVSTSVVIGPDRANRFTAGGTDEDGNPLPAGEFFEGIDFPHPDRTFPTARRLTTTTWRIRRGSTIRLSLFSWSRRRIESCRSAAS